MVKACAGANCRLPPKFGDGKRPKTMYCAYHFAIHEDDRMAVSAVMASHPDLVDGVLSGDDAKTVQLGGLVVANLRHRIRDSKA